MARATCPRPESCSAGPRGPCRACHPQAFDAADLGRKAYWTAERRARQAARLKALHADPAFAALQSANSRKIMQRRHADPLQAAEVSARARRTMLRARQDPAFLAKLAAGQRALRDRQKQARRAAEGASP